MRFWYWHMNFHIEHHMYAAVPCYNLEKLHYVRPNSDTLLTLFVQQLSFLSSALDDEHLSSCCCNDTKGSKATRQLRGGWLCCRAAD